MAPPAAIDSPLSLLDDVYCTKMGEFEFLFPEEAPSCPASPSEHHLFETEPELLTIQTAGEAGSTTWIDREIQYCSERSGDGKRRRYSLVRVDEKTGKPQRPATEEEVAELEYTLTSLLQHEHEQHQRRLWWQQHQQLQEVSEKPEDDMRRQKEKLQEAFLTGEPSDLLLTRRD